MGTNNRAGAGPARLSIMKANFGVLLLGLLAAQTMFGQSAPTAKTADNTPAAEVSLSRTPVAVQAAIKAVISSAVETTVGTDKISRIVEQKDEDGTAYGVEVTRPDGSRRDFMVAGNGDLLSLEVALNEVPGAIQKAIKAQAEFSKITRIDKTFDEDEIAYEVTATGSSGEKNFTISADGQVESAEISIADAPMNVAAAIRKQAGEEKIEAIEKVFEPSAASYDVTISDNSGSERTFTIGPDGSMESREITLAEAPKAVQDAVTTILGKNILVSVDKNFARDGNTYDVVMRPANGRKRDFSLDENGKLLTEQVFLEQLPAAAQKTIAEQIGNGKILHIDKSYELDGGVLPYEIQGEKDGKEFDFRVGPAGRFIGMDN